MQRRTPRLIDGDECWLCPTCGTWRTRRDYYARKRAWNGIGGQCKKCHIEGSVLTRDKDKSRESNRESMARCRARNMEKFRSRDRLASSNRLWDYKREARYQLNLSIRKGVSVRPKRCSRCSKIKKLHAHHSDYSKPLSVEWLCLSCHGREHRGT